jgi:hypothetical protein
MAQYLRRYNSSNLVLYIWFGSYKNPGSRFKPVTSWIRSKSDKGSPVTTCLKLLRSRIFKWAAYIVKVYGFTHVSLTPYIELLGGKCNILAPYATDSVYKYWPWGRLSSLRWRPSVPPFICRDVALNSAMTTSSHTFQFIILQKKVKLSL